MKPRDLRFDLPRGPHALGGQETLSRAGRPAHFSWFCWRQVVDAVGSRRRIRVEQARQSLEDAHQRLDAAILALGTSSDNVILTVPVLALLWEAVVARRHLRMLERDGESEATRSLLEEPTSASDRKGFRLN